MTEQNFPFYCVSVYLNFIMHLWEVANYLAIFHAVLMQQSQLRYFVWIQERNSYLSTGITF